MVRLSDLREPVHLFTKFEMFNIAHEQAESAKKALNAIDADTFLNTPIDDLVTPLYEKYRLEVPELLRDQAHMEEPRETTLTVNDFGRVIHPTGTLLTLVVPFQGDAGMFWVKPSTFDYAPPNANLNNNTIVLRISGQNLTSEHVNRLFNSALDDIEKYLGWQRNDVQRFNDELKAQLRRATENRKQKLLADRRLVAGLVFPMKSRPNASKTYAVPEIRKKIVPEIPKTTAPFEPEPTLSEEHYRHILDVCESMTLVMERSPTAFEHMDEEAIRTHYLVALNAQFEGAATGETFNYEGKTDILIRVNGKNIFIAECKFWRGEKGFVETVDQLLGYLSWRDTKAAIIILNRNRGLSNVLSKIKEAMEKHPHKKRGPTIESDTRFRYVFGNPGDHNREIILTVMVFDVPTP
jgi:hypothetical protein